MKVMQSLFAVALGLMVSSQSLAADPDAKIKEKIKSIGLQATKITDSAVPGLKQVLTNRGVFYMSADSKIFIAGRMFDVDNNMTNLTEAALSDLRLEGMAKYEDSMIVYPAKDEKHTVTVFTDTTCGYCRKLHAQMEDYNKLGITVRYLAFPRGGMDSRSFDEISAVWCAKDQQDAMDKAKNGDSLEFARCNAPIAGHYNLGQAAGVSGTPAIMLEDGSMIPGYKPPAALAQLLEQ